MDIITKRQEVTREEADKMIEERRKVFYNVISGEQNEVTEEIESLLEEVSRDMALKEFQGKYVISE